MPVIEVEIVLQPGETLPAARAATLAADLAQRLGEIFASPPGSTWVRLRSLPPEHYAENDPASPPPFPVFVSVLKRSADPLPIRQVEAQQIAAAVGRICQRPPANVHVLYLPPAAGRQAFGGLLVEPPEDVPAEAP
jgi:phenylpyruvate tautomerase PptA (4-oxalocrotonate tautomerase family)